MRAQMLDGLREPVQGHIQIIRIREHDIPPDGIGAARQSQRVAQAASGERERQTGLIGGLASHAGERDRNQLRQMRYKGRRAVMSGRIYPYRTRANRLDQAHEIGNPRIRLFDSIHLL